jgi:PAS domain S-box-containing protein
MLKTSVTMTKKQLIIENEDLHYRLVEMEETLQAIRSGEVDAIVVSGPKGEQVYSLSTSETPYRNFVEEMHEGALTLDKEGLILFCNKRFARLLNEPADRVMGSNLKRFLIPAEIENLDNLLAKLANAKNDVLNVTLVNSVYLKLSFRHMPLNLHGENFIVIATDITELKKKEMELLELQRLLKRQLEQLLDFRIDLINAKIDINTENNKLKNTNKKLVKEITKLKLEKKN